MAASLATGRACWPPAPALCLSHPRSAPGLVAGQHDVGLDPVIRHREQRHPRLPPLAQHRGDGGQRQPGGQHAGPVQVRRDVGVAQAEPVGPGAVGGEFGQDVVRVPGPAPALFLVDATAEGVHHGVEVGGHVQAEKGDVVAGVAYDGDLGVGSFGYEPAQEASTPNATRGHGDAHGGKSGNRGRPLPAHPP